jgi:hypothetical protein
MRVVARKAKTLSSGVYVASWKKTHSLAFSGHR